MAAIRFTAKPVGMYKSKGDLHAQIAKIYGPGIHFMIPIKKDVYDKLYFLQFRIYNSMVYFKILD